MRHRHSLSFHAAVAAAAAAAAPTIDSSHWTRAAGSATAQHAKGLTFMLHGTHGHSEHQYRTWLLHLIR